MREFIMPFSARDLQLLLQVLKHFRDTAGWLTYEELNHLEITLNSAIHVAEVNQFHKYITSFMPASELDGAELDDAWNKFYETDWVIGFGDMLIKFPSGATIYNHITDFLEEYIQYEL